MFQESRAGGEPLCCANAVLAAAIAPASVAIDLTAVNLDFMMLVS
jgi:hypothetical protein